MYIRYRQFCNAASHGFDDRKLNGVGSMAMYTLKEEELIRAMIDVSNLCDHRTRVDHFERLSISGKRLESIRTGIESRRDFAFR